MWMGLFIAFIMVFSIFGFVVDFALQPSQKLKYGDYKFRVVDQRYITKIDGQEHVFAFFPLDLEYIQLTDDVKRLLAAPVLTITYNPESNLSQNFGEAQYYFELQLQNKAVERAVTNNQGLDLPQKSCADATEQQPVIELQTGVASKISAEGNCIVITSLDAYDVYQQVERIIYITLGVMS